MRRFSSQRHFETWEKEMCQLSGRKNEVPVLVSNQSSSFRRSRHVLRTYFKFIAPNVAVKGVHFKHSLLLPIDSLGVLAVGNVLHRLVQYSRHHDDRWFGVGKI